MARLTEMCLNKLCEFKILKPTIQKFELSVNGLDNVAEILLAVGVLHPGVDLRVQGEVGAEVLEVLLVGQLVGQLVLAEYRGLVRPQPGHVPECVSSTTEDHQGKVELLDELYTLPVTSGGQVEAAEPVAGQAVRAALQHDGRGFVEVHDGLHDGDEDVLVGHVVHALLQRNIDAVVSAGPGPHLVHVTRAREEISVFVEGDGHHSVRQVEGFLNTVSVVDVDVNVQYSKKIRTR